jgi:CRP-like cAMP-binding protein
MHAMAEPAPESERHQQLLKRFGRSFAAGDVVFRDGEPGTEAYLLQKGRVRLLKQIGAVERSLRVLRPGDLFGESALVPGASRNSTAIALDDAVTLALDQQALHQVITANPEIGARVAEQIARRLRDAEDQVEILMLHGTQTKMVAALLKLADRDRASNVGQSAAGGDRAGTGQSAAGGDRAGTGQSTGATALNISPLELSAQVGLDVDTVRANIRRLREAGYLNIIDERIEVPDVDALRELYGLLQVKGRISGPEAAEASSPPGR